MATIRTVTVSPSRATIGATIGIVTVVTFVAATLITVCTVAISIPIERTLLAEAASGLVVSAIGAVTASSCWFLIIVFH